MAPTLSGNPSRVLACVVCRQRKIKCDRSSPCSNCVKAGITCSPSNPIDTGRRKRPYHAVHERLARCEELLEEYATNTSAATTSEVGAVGEESSKAKGKLIVDNNGVQFMNSYLLANVHNELRAMHDILDDHDHDYDHDNSSMMMDEQTPYQNTELSFGDGPDDTLSALHPESAHALRLWQTFLDRVNPLTKVIHVPTVQPWVADAADSTASVPKNVEALLFSIYTLGAIALSEPECIMSLGYTRDEAFARFSKGLRISLMRIGVMDNYDLITLQAMVLHLISLSGRCNHHAAWIMNGVAVRMAQKMGLHMDGEALGISPFESEMRRRVWWQIILIDAYYALMSGLGQSLLPQTWNTLQPSNINDADLYPTMAKGESKDGPTDMIFCLVAFQVAKLLTTCPDLESSQLPRGDGVSDASTSHKAELIRKQIDNLEVQVDTIMKNYGEPSMSPVHEFAAVQGPGMVNRLRDLVCPPSEQQEWGADNLTAKDNLFQSAIRTCEFNLRLYSVTEKHGRFTWFATAHFQVDILTFIAGCLYAHRSGPSVERAWLVIEGCYRCYPDLFNLTVKTNMELAKFILKAWSQRERALAISTGSTPEKPHFVHRVQELSAIQNATDSMSEVSSRLPIRASEMDLFLDGIGMTMGEPWGLGSGSVVNRTHNAGMEPPLDISLASVEGLDLDLWI